MEDFDNLLVFFLGTLNGLFLALILTLLKNFLCPKSEFIYSNKRKAYRKEFHVFTLIEKLKEKSSHIYHQKVPCLFRNCKEIITIKDIDKHMEQCHKMLKIGKNWGFKGTEEELSEFLDNCYLLVPTHLKIASPQSDASRILSATI